MDKKKIAIWATVCVVIFVLAGTWYYFWSANNKAKNAIKNAGDLTNDLADKASQGVLPDINPNPMANAPDVNPVAKTNPFSGIKTNPFK